MSPKTFSFKELRVPRLVVTLAMRRGRAYVSPRFEPPGGLKMSSRLTAMDVNNQEFRTKMRGYDPDEVRLYLKSVAEEIERLNLENGEFREQLGQLRTEAEEFRTRETTLQQTLVTAQRMSAELKDRSEAEAELVLKQARLKAERALQESQDQLARIEAEISRCKLERDLFEKRLRVTLEEHLAVLDQRQTEVERFDNVRMLHPRSGSEVG
jgi:cell division initiation protein